MDWFDFSLKLPITDPTWIFLLVLLIILFAPILLNKLRIPHIIGMILAGLVIGEHGFNILVRDSSKIQIADIKKNNDYAMWLKVIKKANCYHYDKVLAQYRKRSGSISNHGYLKLVKWHYKLFKEADNKNSIASLFLTLQI